MKKPSNKVIAVYLAWVLIHISMWGIAKPGLETIGGYESRFKFFPFAEKFEHSEYDSNFFDIDKVYDMSEFLFYTIAPILIYYIITLFNSKDQTPQ